MDSVQEVTGGTISRQDFILRFATELSDPYIAVPRRQQTEVSDDTEDYVQEGANVKVLNASGTRQETPALCARKLCVGCALLV